MPPRCGRPPLTRSVERGRAFTTEQAETPPHSPHPLPPTSIPAMPTEVAQALTAFFTAMAGQAQTGQVPPIMPQTTPLVSPVQDVSISKKLKKVRQLGCMSFKGELDATVAKDWINQKEKNREFLSLRQGNFTVEEYEARFNELMLYVPDLVKSEQDQTNYFEEGLCNEIRERMTVTGREPHKKVVQMALRADKLANENRRIRAEFANRKNSSVSSSQPPKRGKDSTASRSTTSISVTSPRPPFLQSRQRPSRFSRSAMTGFEKIFRGLDRCKNYEKSHFGLCKGPARCFQCGQTGHIRSDCPQLGRGIAAAPSPPTHMDIQMRDPSGLSPRQEVAIQSGVESNTLAYLPSRS
ncbi:zinc finger protein [Theobroma cacao]|nr:zinc finger protein [Theobroma cacao]